MRRRALHAGLVVALVAASWSCRDSGGGGSAPTVSRPTATTGVATPGAGYRSVVTATIVDNPAFDALQRRIDDTVIDKLGLPGASLLVVHEGKLVEQEVWGSYTLDTVVPIASASKWLSAAMIMTLVDDGVLALDTPISTYVPELAKLPTGAITMRHLLTFTSGLRSEEGQACATDPDVNLLTCARQLIARGLRHQPGAEYRYDSVHLLVAGAIAEIVTGKPFAELFQERIAVPLGMTRTGFFQVKDASRTKVDHPVPAGGAASTLGDYARFLEMLVNDGIAPDGTRILEPATIAEMEKNQTEGLPVYGSSFRRNNQSPYGLGHWVDWTYPDGRTMVSSSPGAFGFRGWIDWENDVFGVYLVRDQTDSDDPDGSPSGGSWIYSMSAEAVGGALPRTFYPHRG